VAVKRIVETTVETETISPNVAADLTDTTLTAKTHLGPGPAEDDIILELELYTNYTIQAQTYTKGIPYRFRRADALRLLAERDNNRPVWRIYRPPAVVREKKFEIVDATRHTMPVEVETVQGLPTQRLDVGTDEEIADILTGEDENITV
jgi:hypothetical protein